MKDHVANTDTILTVLLCVCTWYLGMCGSVFTVDESFS
jgi:uncharacterized membrane protein YqaE (UPF0057 family)